MPLSSLKVAHALLTHAAQLKLIKHDVVHLHLEVSKSSLMETSSSCTLAHKIVPRKWYLYGL